MSDKNTINLGPFVYVWGGVWFVLAILTSDFWLFIVAALPFILFFALFLVVLVGFVAVWFSGNPVTVTRGNKKWISQRGKPRRYIS